jgi:hypothetical protein
MGGSAGKLFHALKNPEDEALLSKSFVAYDKDKSGSLEGFSFFPFFCYRSEVC